MAVAAITSRWRACAPGGLGHGNQPKRVLQSGLRRGRVVLGSGVARSIGRQSPSGWRPSPRPGARPQQHRGSAPGGGPGNAQAIRPAISTLGLRWAAWSGRTMHRLAQFHAISRPAAAPAGPAPWNDEDPPAGNLPAELLRITCGALAEHTGTTESCWFCLWNGYGWLYGSPWAGIMGRRGPIAVPPAFPAEVLDGPRVRLPGRDYLLFAGSLAAAPELGWADPYGSFVPQSPQPVLAAGPCLVRG